MDKENTEIQEAVVEQAGLPTPLEIELDANKAIARISAIANVIEGCAKVSIQRTNPKDWVRMKHSGKESFYLQASGAQKIRPIWGIYYRNREITRETYPDGSYGYVVTGEVGSKVLDQLYGEVTVTIDGGRNSADAFFTGRDGQTVPDPMDVRKAALANWEARAVTAVLGLKNLSAADLQKNGIDPKNVAGFEFKDKAMGGGKSSEFISQAQAKRLFAIARNTGVTDEEIKKYLQDEYGYTSTSEIKRSEYDEICKAAEQGFTGKPKESEEQE